MILFIKVWMGIAFMVVKWLLYSWPPHVHIQWIPWIYCSLSNIPIYPCIPSHFIEHFIWKHIHDLIDFKQICSPPPILYATSFSTFASPRVCWLRFSFFILKPWGLSRCSVCLSWVLFNSLTSSCSQWYIELLSSENGH